jgi:hypothetical protein
MGEMQMVGISKRTGGRKLTIGVSTMPYRKKPCLVVEEGNTLTKYATFNNDESAYEFMDLFCDFMGVERIEWFGREEDVDDK